MTANANVTNTPYRPPHEAPAILSWCETCHAMTRLADTPADAPRPVCAACGCEYDDTTAGRYPTCLRREGTP